MRNPYNLEELTPVEYVVKGLQIFETDVEEGKKYLLTAAENYYPKAYHLLGMAYAKIKDFENALFYVFKAYDRGYYDLKELLFVYTRAYAEGYKKFKRQMLEILDRLPEFETIKDYALLSYIGICLYAFNFKKEACKYLKKAVRREMGEDAYYHLGLCFREGIGIEQDIEYSYTCFMLANDYPSRELIEKEIIKYKKKGFIKRKWKYKEKYAKRNEKKSK